MNRRANQVRDNDKEHGIVPVPVIREKVIKVLDDFLHAARIYRNLPSAVSVKLYWRDADDYSEYPVYDSTQGYCSSLPLLFDDDPFAAVVLRTPSLDQVDASIGARSIAILVPLLQYVLDGEPRFQSIQTKWIGDVLRQVREYQRISIVEMAAQLGIDVEKAVRWEGGARFPLFQDFYRWLEILNLVHPSDRSLVRIIDVTSQLTPAFVKHPSELFQLSPEAFEQFVAERLEKMGYSVTIVGKPNRKDGGIDIIAVPKSNGNYLLATQVKHHKKENKSGRTDVDRLLAWKGREFAMGMLVTNTTFTKDAIATANDAFNKHFLKLRDFDDLKKWITEDFTGECREIPNEIQVAPGIVVKIQKPDLAKAFQGAPVDRQFKTMLPR